MLFISEIVCRWWKERKGTERRGRSVRLGLYEAFRLAVQSVWVSFCQRLRRWFFSSSASKCGWLFAVFCVLAFGFVPRCVYLFPRSVIANSKRFFLPFLTWEYVLGVGCRLTVCSSIKWHGTAQGRQVMYCALTHHFICRKEFFLLFKVLEPHPLKHA